MFTGRRISGTTIAAGVGWAVLSAATGAATVLLAGTGVAAADPADDGSADAVRSADQRSRATATARQAKTFPGVGSGARHTAAPPRQRGSKPAPAAVQRVADSQRPAAAQTKASPGTPPLAAVTRSDPLTALLGNSAPRPVGIQTGQSPGGIVSGSVDATDHDGDPIGLAVTRAPAHGTVTLSPSGQYTYTADPMLARRDSVDSFEVTASDDGSGENAED